MEIGQEQSAEDFEEMKECKAIVIARGTREEMDTGE